MYLFSSFRDLTRLQRSISSGKKSNFAAATEDWDRRFNSALLISFVATAVFSLAQYGLTEYHWYVLCGLSVAVSRIASGDKEKVQTAVVETVEGTRK